MLSFRQFLIESLSHPHIDFDTWHGKAFRVVTTPSGQSVSSTTGEVIPDEPGRVSIVTPENGDAWHWPDAHPDTIEHFRKNWSEIQTNLADHKRSQIQRAIGQNLE